MSIVHQRASRRGTLMVCVTVAVGINDVLQAVREQDFEENYERIASQLETRRVAIVITNLPDFTAGPALSKSQNESMRARLAAFNRRIERVATRYNLPLVHLYEVTEESLRSHPELFSEDGMHPSAAGYRVWADTMWPAVKQAIER